MEWAEIFASFGITSIWLLGIILLIGLFGKKAVEHYFEKLTFQKEELLQRKVEQFKGELNHKLEKETEAYRAQLNQISFEHQTKYSQLHLHRAEVIKDLYSKLISLDEKMQSLMRPFQAVGEPSFEVKVKLATDAANEFVKFYKNNEIYFNAEVCKIFEKINEVFLKAWRDFSRSRQFAPTAGPDLSQELINNELNAYYELLLKEVPVLKTELVNNFRHLLGVS